MHVLDRISHNPTIVGGKSIIRGMRVTVGTVVGLVASGYSFADILEAYPYLEEEDIKQALAYDEIPAEQMWSRVATAQFVAGYAKADASYDRLDEDITPRG